MLKNHTGTVKRVLSTGTTDNPSLTQGAETSFKLSDLPLVTRNMCNYLAGFKLSIAFTLTQSGGTGTRLLADNVIRALLSYVKLTGAFHGTPIRADKYLGAYQWIVEHWSNGYGPYSPVPSAIPAANGAYSRQIHLFIPLGLFTNEDGMHTTPPVAFFQKAQLAFGISAASVLSAMSTGASLSALSAKCTAVMVPDPEIRLPPGIELADYTAPYSSGNLFTLDNFGNDTGFKNCESGAAIIQAGILTSVNGLGGAVAANNLTSIFLPWRDQEYATHLDPFFADARDAMDGFVVGSAQDAATSQGTFDSGRWPYALGTDVTAGLNNANALLIPLVVAGKTAQLSKCQHVDGNVPIGASFSSGSGTHHVLALQAKRWSQQMERDALDLLVQSGVVREVLGGTSWFWDLKMAGHQPKVTPRKAKYLPKVLRQVRAAA